MFSRKNTISGERLATDWNIDVYELCYLTIKKDLTVLNPPKFPSILGLLNSKNKRISSEKLLEIIQTDPTNLFEKSFWLPEIENLAENIEFIDLIKPDTIDHTKPDTKKPKLSIMTESSEIRQRQHRYVSSKSIFLRLRDKKRKYQQTLKNIIEDHEDKVKKHGNVFSLIGKTWFVKFKNDEWGLFMDKERYHYIFHMLDMATTDTGNLEYSIYNTDLIAKIKRQDIVTNNKENLKNVDLLKSHLGNELSPDEIKSIKNLGYKLLYELIDARKTNDLHKINSKQKKLDKYRSYILNEYGIKCIVSKNQKGIYFKVIHRPSKEIEKLRQLIKNQILNAIKDFKECMPMLGRHLRNSLKTKIYKTVYQPEDSIHWYVST